MATDPNDIRLSSVERQRLARLADKRGSSWTTIVEELIDSAEAILGIERGLKSAARGEALSAEDVHRELRDRYDLISK